MELLSKFVVTAFLCSISTIIAANANETSSVFDPAFARGLDAIGLNPARAFSATNDMIIPTAGAYFGNNMTNLDDINFYFGGNGTDSLTGDALPRKLTIDERNRLADFIDRGELNLNISLTPIAFTYSLGKGLSLNFALSSTAMIQNRFPDDFSKIIKGYLGSDVINLDDIQTSGLAYTSFALGCAYNYSINERNELSIGATSKYLMGHGYASTQSDSYIRIAPFVPAEFDSLKSWAIQTDYQLKTAGNSRSSELFSSPAGSGISFDFGAVYTLIDKAGEYASLSASIIDLGTINWTENARSQTLQVTDTLKGVAQFDEDRLDAYDAEKKDISSFSSSMPLRLNVGGTYNLSRLIGLSLPIYSSLNFQASLNSDAEIYYGNTISAGIYFLGKNFFPRISVRAILSDKYDPSASISFGFNLLDTVIIDFGTLIGNVAGDINSQKQIAGNIRIMWQGMF